MFETTKILLVENTRSLNKKIKSSPVLYFFFTSMMLFSILMFAFLTLFVMNTEAEISITDLFFTIFFIFTMKSAHDFYIFFIKSPEINYPLSTQINQKQTIFEIFLAVFLTELFIWFSFSALFLIFVNMLGININYPQEYLIFTIGVISGIFIGCCLSTHYFSSTKIRLIPSGILLGFFWYSQNILFIALMLPVAVLHFIWCLNHSMESYLYVNRKERIKEKTYAHIRKPLQALFNREITVLWRDRLLFSFIFTSVSSAIVSGYLVLYGTELFVPEVIRERVSEFLPSMFVFLGLYIVVIYTSVFPSLNLFLNEEKTIWILRNLPIKNDTMIFGKASSLMLCFVTAIPFVAYITIFIGIEHIIFVLWLLVFSYIAGVIISLPLGAKYVGKKSDILLLYTVAMILFVGLAIIANISNFIVNRIDFEILFYIIVLLIECGVLYLSLKLSSNIMSVKN